MTQMDSSPSQVSSMHTHYGSSEGIQLDPEDVQDSPETAPFINPDAEGTHDDISGATSTIRHEHYLLAGTQSSEDAYDDPESVEFFTHPDTQAVFENVMSREQAHVGPPISASRSVSFSVPPPDAPSISFLNVAGHSRSTRSLPPTATPPSSPTKRRIIPKEGAHPSIVTTAARREAQNAEAEMLTATPSQMPEPHHQADISEEASPPVETFAPAQSPQTAGASSFDAATAFELLNAPATSTGGRPSNEQRTVLSSGFQEQDRNFCELAAKAKVPPFTAIKQYFKRFGLGAVDNQWNGYLGFARANRKKEVARLLDSDNEDIRNLHKPFAADPEKKPSITILAITYQLFLQAHGEEAAKDFLADWSDLKASESSASAVRKSDRRRTFDTASRHLAEHSDMMENLHQMHFVIFGVGGQVLSDQSLLFAHEPAGCKGFCERHLLKKPEQVLAHLRAHACNTTVEEITNQELIAMAQKRGLILVEAQSADDDDIKEEAPSKQDVPRLLKTELKKLASQANFDYGKTLPWTSMAKKCVEKGFRIVNYPFDVTIPWELQGTARRKGVKGLPQTEQLKLLAACKPTATLPVRFEPAPPLRNLELYNHDIPVLTCTPDPSGKVKEAFVDKAGSIPRPGGAESAVKAESEDHSLTDMYDSDTDVPARIPRADKGKSAVAMEEEVDEIEDDEDEDGDDAFGDGVHSDDGEWSANSPKKVCRKVKGRATAKTTTTAKTTSKKIAGKSPNKTKTGSVKVTIPAPSNQDIIMGGDETPKPSTSKRKQVNAPEPEPSDKRIKVGPSQLEKAGFTAFDKIDRLRERQGSTLPSFNEGDFKPLPFAHPPITTSTPAPVRVMSTSTGTSAVAPATRRATATVAPTATHRATAAAAPKKATVPAITAPVQESAAPSSAVQIAHPRPVAGAPAKGSSAVTSPALAQAPRIPVAAAAPTRAALSPSAATLPVQVPGAAAAPVRAAAAPVRAAAAPVQAAAAPTQATAPARTELPPPQALTPPTQATHARANSATSTGTSVQAMDTYPTTGMAGPPSTAALPSSISAPMTANTPFNPSVQQNGAIANPQYPQYPQMHPLQMQQMMQQMMRMMAYGQQPPTASLPPSTSAHAQQGMLDFSMGMPQNGNGNQDWGATEGYAQGGGGNNNGGQAWGATEPSRGNGSGSGAM
ncbi:hypothetical protein AAF712_011092 [Marasmius tenuissimus]|uniref:Uncharacterized protein n=1 Tax=Marasmius tenuissimus TaxID=585030 RepID=A0ABR2ZLD4_9AGAR